MTVELERLEAKFAVAGVADPGDLDLYFRGCGNLRRLLEGLGLERRARDVTTIIDTVAETSWSSGLRDRMTAKEPIE
jgi:hypothetical protein